MSYSLYIDELGESTPFRFKKSPYFILTGCVILDEKRDFIMKNLEHIKYKYWDDTEIIFHSVNIGRKEKDFSIFKSDLGKFNSFVKNLNDFFALCPMFLLCVVVDQKRAYESNWNQKTVIKKAYQNLIENYIRILMAKNEKGQIIQEASTSMQDLTIYEQFFNYQTLGIAQDGISHINVKEHLTGVSFLTKKSLDTVSQLSDLLGYGIKMEILHIKEGKLVNSMTKYQQMIRGKALGKLLHSSQCANEKKNKLYKNIDSLKILP